MQNWTIENWLDRPGRSHDRPADQFKSWENRPENSPGYELADIYRPEVT